MAWTGAPGAVPIIIIIIIAAFAVGPLTAKVIEDRQSYNNSDDLLINNNELNESHHFSSNQTALIKSRKAGSRCKSKDICIIMGGSCVTEAILCGGKLVPGCKGKNCKCCVSDSLEMKINSLEQMLQTMQSNFTDAHSYIVSLIMRSISCSNDTGCPVGFFQTSGSSQCYKFYNDTKLSYQSGKEVCQGEGLVLAEPINPISLRKYLVETYGTQTWAYVYLGAHANGTNFRWERSGRQISNTDALWWTGHAGPLVSTSHCLLLLSYKSNMDSQPNQPYLSYPCTSKQYTLCEYV